MQPNDRKNEMEKMRLEGYTLQEIGDKYGITRERVRQLVGDRVDGYSVRAERAKNFADLFSSVYRNNISGVAKKLRASVVVAGKGRGKTRNVVSGNGTSFNGHKIEEIVSHKLNEISIKNELMPNHHIFDILVFNSIRVEVKGAIKKAKTSDKQVSPMYRFHVKKDKKGDFCDYFIFYISDTKDFFVIPNKEIGYVSNVYITYPTVYRGWSKWMQYKNRFDLLKG